MIEIKNCPSSLAEGFDTYSPKIRNPLSGNVYYALHRLQMT